MPDSVVKLQAAARLISGDDYVFQYDDTLVTVSKGEGFVHLYSAGTITRSAAKRFMRDVWRETSLPQLFAPIRNPQVQALALRLGWHIRQTYANGFTMLSIERKPS